MDDPRPSRAVPFPLARPDAVLRYRTADLVMLSKLMDSSGDQDAATPVWWLAQVERRLLALDVPFIVNALRLGLKTGDTFTPLTLLDGDDLPFALTEATRPISDALLCAISGQPYSALQAKRQKLLQEQDRPMDAQP